MSRARPSPTLRSIARRSRRRWSSRRCSATPRARSPARPPPRPGYFEDAQRRHAVPGRDRRAAARDAGEAAARAGERRVPARRRDREPRVARARDRRDQPRPAPGSARGALSAPTSTTGSRCSRWPCRRCATWSGDKLLLLGALPRASTPSRPACRRFRSTRRPQQRWLALPVPGQRARAAQHRHPAHHQARAGSACRRRAGARVRPRARARRPRPRRARATSIAQAQRAPRAQPRHSASTSCCKRWERGYIEAALRLTRGNVSQAAKLLGVNRTTLYSRMNDIRGQGAGSRWPCTSSISACASRRSASRRITDFFFDGADRGATLEALLYAILHDEGIVKVAARSAAARPLLCRVLMERLPAAGRDDLPRQPVVLARRDPARDRRGTGQIGQRRARRRSRCARCRTG